MHQSISHMAVGFKMLVTETQYFQITITLNMHSKFRNETNFLQSSTLLAPSEKCQPWQCDKSTASGVWEKSSVV